MRGGNCTECRKTKRRCDGNDPCEQCVKKSAPEPCSKCRKFKIGFASSVYCEECPPKQVICRRPNAPKTETAILFDPRSRWSRNEGALEWRVAEVEYIRSLATREIVNLIAEYLKSPFKGLEKSQGLQDANCDFGLYIQRDSRSDARLVAVSTMNEPLGAPLFDKILGEIASFLPHLTLVPETGSLRGLDFLRFLQHLPDAVVHVPLNQSSKAQRKLVSLFWRLIQHATRKLVDSMDLPAPTLERVRCPKWRVEEIFLLVNLYLSTAERLKSYLPSYRQPQRFNTLNLRSLETVKSLHSLLKRSSDLLNPKTSTSQSQAYGLEGSNPDLTTYSSNVQHHLHIGITILDSDQFILSEASNKHIDICSNPAAPILDFLFSGIVGSYEHAAQPAPAHDTSVQQDNHSKSPVTLHTELLPVLSQGLAINAYGSGDASLTQSPPVHRFSSATIGISGTSTTEVESYSDELHDSTWLNYGEDTASLPKHHSSHLQSHESVDQSVLSSAIHHYARSPSLDFIGSAFNATDPEEDLYDPTPDVFEQYLA